MSIMAAPKSILMPAAIAKNEVAEGRSRIVVGGLRAQYRTSRTRQGS
jgi:hypothetical protein